MNDKQMTQVENAASMLAKLPPDVQQKFLYMAQGAALVAEAKERTEAAG